MTFVCLYISRWWRQTWDTAPYVTVVNQSEARISTEHGIKLMYLVMSCLFRHICPTTQVNDFEIYKKHVFAGHAMTIYVTFIETIERYKSAKIGETTKDSIRLSSITSRPNICFLIQIDFMLFMQNVYLIKLSFGATHRCVVIEGIGSVKYVFC